MQIRVIRNGGTRQGGDIIDSLLTAVPAGRARGTHEINESASKKITDSNAILLPADIQLGTMARVSGRKGTYKAEISFFSQTIDIDEKGNRYYPSSSLKLKRPARENSND